MNIGSRSTCADLNNSDGMDSLGLMFYKKMDYTQRNKFYSFNVYAVIDLEKYITAHYIMVGY